MLEIVFINRPANARTATLIIKMFNAKLARANAQLANKLRPLAFIAPDKQWNHRNAIAQMECTMLATHVRLAQNYVLNV